MLSILPDRPYRPASGSPPSIVRILAIGGLIALGSGCVAPSAPRGVASDDARGALLETTWQILSGEIPDLPLTEADLAEARAEVVAVRSFAEEREVVRRLIDRIPASHIALFSSYARRIFEAELAGRESPTIGFFIAGIGDEYFIAKVLAGTPAAEAGLRRGDRILAIDGVPLGRSPRLDPRHDDAAPPGDAAHLLRVRPGERVAVAIRRGTGETETDLAVRLPVTVTSSLRADRRACRIVAHDGVNVGVLPLSYLYSRDTTRHVASALAGPLLEAEALVLDLRGRGGSAIALLALTGMLEQRTIVGDLPIVAAIDRRSRSAKEVLARNIRERGIGTLVGERTPGAVRPARWLPVLEGTWLLCPRGPVGEDPRGLEGVGVAPDIAVADPFPHGDGGDPILEAAIVEAARQVHTAR